MVVPRARLGSGDIVGTLWGGASREDEKHGRLLGDGNRRGSSHSRGARASPRCRSARFRESGRRADNFIATCLRRKTRVAILFASLGA